MKTWYTPSALLLSLAVMFPISTHAQSNPSIESLRGIKSIYVLVEDLASGADRVNLTKNTIQTDVELKLRLAGLRVESAEEAVQKGDPYIYVNVNLTDDAGAADASVQIAQDATLDRTRQSVVGAITWQRMVVIEKPSADGIRERVKDLTDSFLNDWLSVNPKN